MYLLFLKEIFNYHMSTLKRRVVKNGGNFTILSTWPNLHWPTGDMFESLTLLGALETDIRP